MMYKYIGIPTDDMHIKTNFLGKAWFPKKFGEFDTDDQGNVKGFHAIWPPNF